jgi:uncharacterized protein
MKKQVMVIHGGETFRSYKDYFKFIKTRKIDFSDYANRKPNWKKDLPKNLGKGYEVIFPAMPNPLNARYKEWKIWFDKFVLHIKPGAILIGHSLGGIFLAKFLSENKLGKKIKALFLVAAPFDEKDIKDSLADFRLKKDLSLIEKQAMNIFIYHSKDDKIVPFADSQKFLRQLPGAVFRSLKNRGHFIQEKFPEIVKDIKRLGKQGR